LKGENVCNKRTFCNKSACIHSWVRECLLACHAWMSVRVSTANSCSRAHAY
jgi:hypothetical protein